MSAKSQGGYRKRTRRITRKDKKDGEKPKRTRRDRDGRELEENARLHKSN